MRSTSTERNGLKRRLRLAAALAAVVAVAAVAIGGTAVTDGATGLDSPDASWSS